MSIFLFEATPVRQIVKAFLFALRKKKKHSLGETGIIYLSLEDIPFEGLWLGHS